MNIITPDSNNTDAPIIKTPVRYDEYGGGYFWDADETMIAQTRGWGELIGVGGRHLPEDEAAKIQDARDQYIATCINDHAQLLSENAELREVIAEALEPGVFAMEDRSGIHTSEDEMVMNLGRRIGFGALMDSASRMWAIVAKDNDMEGSEYTCGPCAAVRRSWVEKAKKALGETK